MADGHVTGVDFVTIPTQDFEAADRFYGDVLGLERSKQWGDMPAREFETENLTIAVMQMDAFGQKFGAHPAPLALQVPDAAAAKAALEEKGVEFLGEPIDSGVCHMHIFQDPDGNTLMLHERYAPVGESPPAS